MLTTYLLPKAAEILKKRWMLDPHFATYKTVGCRFLNVAADEVRRLSQLWKPAPILVAHPTLFTSDEIELFEKEILFKADATEHDASRFFEKHPKFLLTGSGAEIRREVVLSTDDGNVKRRVDFFRRNYGEKFWDIVELKSPSKPFLSGVASNHPKVSSSVSNAVNQALDYRDLIIQDSGLRARLLKLGIAVCRPQVTVIVGKVDNAIDDEQLAVLYDRIRTGPVDARTYFDLYHFAKDHFASNHVVISGRLSIEAESIVSFGPPELKSFITSTSQQDIVSIGIDSIIDATLIQSVGDSLLEAIEASEKQIVVDLSNVQFMSSAMIGKLILADKRSSIKNRKIKIGGAQENVMRVFDLLKLDQFFDILPPSWERED